MRGATPSSAGVTTIVAMLAASSSCHCDAFNRPTSSPDRPRMNENSPTCARPIPAVAATRIGVAAIKNALVATVALTITSTIAMPMITGNCRSSTEGSTNIPSEMKNNPARMSRSGRISAYA